MSADYRDTVLMPRTGFPMKARLPEREPAMAAHWEETGLYRRLREQAAGRPKFVLHDGPPYANGHLHLGTALNKILKDVVVRSQQMLGQGFGLRAGLGLPWPADRVAGRAGLAQAGARQGLGAGQRVPGRLPRLRGALDRRAAG